MITAFLMHLVLITYPEDRLQQTCMLFCGMFSWIVYSPFSISFILLPKEKVLLKLSQ